MLGVDGLTQERWRREVGRETAVERRQRILAENLEKAEISVADDAGHDVSNLLEQLGRPLSCSEVMRRLKLCSPAGHRLTFEQSKACPDKMGVYVNLLVKNTTGAWQKKKLFVCGMESGIMPEFSVLHKRTINVPDNDLFNQKKPTREVEWKQAQTFEDETRGWRTVLIRLWHAGLIDSPSITQHFGWTPSRDSEKWHKLTKG